MERLDNVVKSDMKDLLFDEKTIKNRVEDLGKEITKHYENDESELVVVGILRGSTLFFADLIRYINLPISIDFMAISSYGNSSESGVVKIIKDLEADVTGKNILIVEDIIDTGKTLKYLLNYFKERGAKTVKIASMLDKPERRLVEISGDFVGFAVPNDFIVGYGLDYNQSYRNLPYIISLKEEVYK
ncbi:hypoxanthine phosphoribosyltransferase [Parvimonas micra]|uniref:hypoxanthine phosphoribosyltransferase n=1 Tax=Parvimonas TaxID=543311 RepID=UPI00020DCD5E|nr:MULTISPECIES: hypoxanthine phosphoribosyltransferase [unclassified Parvimonas]EGL38740.1 hypoxanthine phosphoribosyltransferase [Parvimonas sp. oral taxon 110 str. F0139]MBF1294516.1 hypoxanthine phosphoribosyltransferase [Parvimonas sp.]MBF1299785.1 hypoxanthine phosphoribosyltransferase [Parvimonas sp.]MEB3011719.1 hypoxanthine phosphoribosyltransferase [Parvimonas sp. D2]MEB3087211.1 hypoxanthine phosphoribosyltransferase [Parvimonas sp. D4]